MLYLVRVMISTVDDFRHTYNFTAIVPLYNGETAPKAMRGMLLVLYQLQIIVGFVAGRNNIIVVAYTSICSIFLSYIIDLGTHFIDGPASWRIPVGLQLAWGAILLSGIFFLPESPYVLPRCYLSKFSLLTLIYCQASPTWYWKRSRGAARRGGSQRPA